MLVPIPPLKSMTSSRNRGAPLTRLAYVLLLPLLSHQLTALKRKNASTCPLWMRGRAIRPSHAEPHLHSLDAPTRWLDNRLRCCTEHRPGAQVFQAKMLISEEASLDAALLRDLRSTTDLALRATKATAQAIRRLMSSLIVLERHLWLTMTEMKEADKVPFLDAPVSLRNTDLEHRSSRPRCSPVRKPVWMQLHSGI